MSPLSRSRPERLGPLRQITVIVIISLFRTQRCTARVPALRQQPSRVERFATKAASLQLSVGQVAQVVERSPEKAGVGGSTPSLATIIPSTYLAVAIQFCPILSQKIQTRGVPELAS